MKKNNLFFIILLLFAGAVCFTSCKDECEDVNCQNGGTCIEGDCECPEGFTGINCQTELQPDPCENITCENGGTCNDGNCDCQEGFTGTNCETVVDPCENVTCENGGTCNDGNCDCQEGFTGANCETVVEDSCENVTCENGGTCNEGTCDCPEGFTGTNCETVVDPCETVICENGGTCNEGICDCPEGFTGENCETMVDPPDACADIDATFDGDVIGVLSVTCSYDACHGAASMFGQKDYNVFSNLQPFLEDGSFEKRVLNGGDADNPVMPPPYAPEGNPKELTEEQLQILMCWKEAGYPEN